MPLRNIILFIFFVSLSLSEDPCQFTANTVSGNCITYPANVRECFESIPLSEDVVGQTLSVMDQLITLYSFTDIASNSGSPYDLTVDLRAELAIFNQSFSSDWDFHLKMVTLFNRLNDGHTLYYSPNGYQQFYTLRPFLLTSSLDSSGKQIITVVSESAEGYGEFVNMDLRQYIGKTVESINGTDAVSYIMNFANDIGTYKDWPIRFNAALQNSFTYISHASMGVPSYDSETWVFKDAGSVTIPLVSIVINGLNGTDQLVQMNQYSSDNTETYKRNDKHVMAIGPDFILKKQKEQLNKEKVKTEAKRGSNFQVILATDTMDTIYGIWNGDTAVLKLTTFEPSTNLYTVPWDAYRHVVEFSVQDAHSRGIKNMIIDVIGNGGGYVCLSYATLRFFIKAFDGTGVYQPYDFRESPTTSELTTVQYISSNERFQLGTLSTYCDNSWYGPVEYTRGNYESKYTNKWALACPEETSDRSQNFWMNNYGIYMDKLIVLTDGTCGSACNYFASKMKYDTKAYLVSIGGVVGMPMDIASFAGGNVLDWSSWVSDVQSYLTSAEVTIYDLPQQLPTSAFTRYNFAEVYFGDTVPREFIRMEADKHVNNWNFQSPDRLYGDITPIFDDFPGGWPSGQTSHSKSKSNKVTIIIAVVVPISVVLIIAVGVVIYLRKRQYKGYTPIVYLDQ